MPPIANVELHPETQQALVDRFGTPVGLGSRVIIAKKQHIYGSGGAALFEGVIKKITPLILHPRYGGYNPQQWFGSQSARLPLVRLDQLHKSRQTEYLVEVDRDNPPDWRRCFLVGVEIPGAGRLIVVAFGENLIAVPA